MMMVLKERILAAMRRQPADYAPCVPLMNFQPEDQRWGNRWQFPVPHAAGGNVGQETP